MRTQLILLAAACGVAPMLCAQQPVLPVVNLKAIERVEIPVGYPMWSDKATCDKKGNAYVRTYNKATLGTSEMYLAPVQEFSPAGRLEKSFPNESRTFFVHDGSVYSLARSHGKSPDLYVQQTEPVGSVSSQTKLELDFFVDVSGLAVFKSGEYLVFGLTGAINERSPHLRTPFTAVFAKDGRLVKKIYEPEDEDAHLRAEGSDPKYLLCCSDSGNEFVGLNADVTAGSDGNIYLLHGTSPPLIYVISPAGEVVRKLRIDTGNPDLTANSVKFYGGHLAIGFNWLGNATKSLIKVIDTKGNPIANYEIEESSADSDPILACYNSEGFALVPRSAEAKLYLVKVRLPH